MEFLFLTMTCHRGSRETGALDGEYSEPIESGVSVFDIMGEFVPDRVFNSALIWKRLIRSVCEQEFAKLKSSRLVLM